MMSSRCEVVAWVLAGAGAIICTGILCGMLSGLGEVPSVVKPTSTNSPSNVEDAWLKAYKERLANDTNAPPVASDVIEDNLVTGSPSSFIWTNNIKVRTLRLDSANTIYVGGDYTNFVIFTYGGAWLRVVEGQWVLSMSNGTTIYGLSP